MAARANSKARTQATVNRARAVELRCQGMSQQAIADELGVSRPSVSQYISRAQAELRATTLEDADRLRQMELAVLLEVRDRALIAWGRYEGQNAVIVNDGETYLGEPIDAKGARLLAEVTKTSESIRKMLGLDAPVQVVSRTGSLDEMTEDEARQILAEVDNVPTG
jgi:DNA-binding CsgD family transcriptional regulator